MNVFKERFSTGFEMMPLDAFIITYYFISSKNLFIATAVCIIFSWVQLWGCKVRFNKVRKNSWVSTILITILGGLIIILHYKTFAMSEPTIFGMLFLLLGLSMLIGQVVDKASVRTIFWMVPSGVLVILLSYTLIGDLYRMYH